MLLGNNGVGKTTLLQCFTFVEPTDFPRADESRTIGRGALRKTFAPEEFIRFHVLEKAKISTEILWGREIGETRGKTHRKKLKTESYRIGTPDFVGFVTESQTFLGLECYAYGASRRMGAGTLADSDDDSRTISLFDENAELRNAEEWLLRTDYAASKRSSIQADAKTRAKLIRSVLIDLLPDVDDIRFPPPEDVDAGPRVEFHTTYGWVPIRRLGLGTRP